jgi:aspartyl-tRNA(Asn)/glutamyl-tRNA(Gln) amidotransferase subunit A
MQETEFSNRQRPHRPLASLLGFATDVHRCPDDIVEFSDSVIHYNDFQEPRTPLDRRMPTPISIVDAARQFRAGTLTPLDLLGQCFEQIHKYEDVLHAWVVIDEGDARQTATQRTREAALRQWRGPLHGIPIGIKDIIDVQGLATGAGSPLCGHQSAVADAPVVAALRRAGAVILGKAVTVEFACFDPPPTRNPWNLRHTPGGSSSGAAAALAMGMCSGALGTQTGGSLVRPATYCGVATCKPTFGKLSTESIVPVSPSLDHVGPMARKVGDLTLLLGCLLDVTAPLPLRPCEPPRLGLLDPGMLAIPDEAVQGAMQSVLKALTQVGAEIQPVSMPQIFGDVLKNHRQIMAAEAAAYHRERFASHRDQYGPKIASLLDEGLAITAVDYLAAKAWHREFRRQAADLLDGVDALIMPSTHTTAPATLETTGTPHFQVPWSLARLPVVSIPCGIAADGMPAGIQLIGRADDEMKLLSVATWCEQILGFDALPALSDG